MSKYGVDRCTECGQMSELLLAPRFPHICSRCLFPPAQPDPRELVQALMTGVRKAEPCRVLGTSFRP